METPTALPHVEVDVVVFTLCQHDLKVCLVRVDNTTWQLPGGFVAIHEGLEEAALRQLVEKTGVSAVYLQQLYTFGTPDRIAHQRLISVVYLALIAASKLPIGCTDTTGPSMMWHSVYALPPLLLDHGAIIDYALTRLRYKIEYSAAAFELLPEEFTLRELQDAYMIILNDRTLDKANFRKKLREAEILEPVSRYRETGGRPAKLYRFRKDAQLEVKARRFFP
ncbi:MAG: NUDIX domain-containing protein [Chloroflexota bacterium]|nr:NUDIX domain-containing protein [Chloroflexota bacterium]